MAVRSGAGTGVIVALVVFVISTICLLVLSIVFYSQLSDERESLLAAESDLNQFATAQQRGRDEVKAVLTAAQGARQSGVQYLMGLNDDAMTKITGNPGDMASLGDQLLTYGIDQNSTVIRHLTDLENELRAARAEADSYRNSVADLNNLVGEKDAQLRLANDNTDAAVAGVMSRLGQYFADLEQYKTDVEQAVNNFLDSLATIEDRHTLELRDVESSLDELRADLALKDEQFARISAAYDATRIKSKDPSLLVDATILDNADGRDQVYIDRGRQDRIVLGMTFEVYDNAASLRIDEFGGMPRGKASIQVIKVAETTSTCKITRSSPGRPVVLGDVVANAVYDPDREYMFLVHGHFDIDGDGHASAAEAESVRSLIRNWGGKVVEGDELRGDLDFLVMGVQPAKPGGLPPGATQREIQDWVRRNTAFEKYDTLFNKAIDADIPSLNMHRFFILIGHTNR